MLARQAVLTALWLTSALFHIFSGSVCTAAPTAVSQCTFPHIHTLFKLFLITLTAAMFHSIHTLGNNLSAAALSQVGNVGFPFE